MDADRSTPRDAAEPGRDGVDDPRRRHIVLIGLMGAGKTSVGLRVARRLGRPFVDSDMIVALDSDRTPVELERDAGAAALHDAELDALRRVIGGRDAVVYAAAASVLDADPVAELAPAWVVWLEAPPEVLAARLAADHARPILGADPVSTLRDQAASRDERGRSLADLCVDVTRGDPEELATFVVEAWHERHSIPGPDG